MLPAVDIPILAEPDQFVGQTLDAMGVKKSMNFRLPPALKSLGHWNENIQPLAPATRQEPMTMWNMAMAIASSPEASR